MTSPWLIALAALPFLVTVGLLIAASVKVRRQNFLIKLQNEEIEKRVRQLIDQNTLSEQLVREKRQLISLVSHDLKGPFNRLYALMQLLEMESTTLTTGQHEYLGKMYQIVSDGLNMVRNLVDVRELEDRAASPYPELLNVGAVINSIVNHYRVTAEKKSIRIYLEEPSLPEFVTDRGFLSRIIENLLSNAIKFSAAGRNVYVSVRQLNEQEIEMSIRDEGPGISPEDQRKLYNTFQKLSSKPTGGESSTGLGLSIVKQLVSRLGGEVTCTSALNEGSDFRVRLPKMTLAKESPHGESSGEKG